MKKSHRTKSEFNTVLFFFYSVLNLSSKCWWSFFLPESSLTPAFMPFSWCFSSSQKKKTKEKNVRTHLSNYIVLNGNVYYITYFKQKIMIRVNEFGNRKRTKKTRKILFFSLTTKIHLMMITKKWSKNIQIALLLSMLLMPMMMVCINLKRNFRNKLVHHQFLMTLNSVSAFDKVHWISK